MSRDNELDEILASLKKRRNDNSGFPEEKPISDTETEIEPPEKKISDDNSSSIRDFIDDNSKEDVQSVKEETIAPPEIYDNHKIENYEYIESTQTPFLTDINDDENKELIWLNADELSKAEKKKANKFKIKKSKKGTEPKDDIAKKISLKDIGIKIKANFKKNFLPKVKSTAKKIFTKQVAITVGAILLVIILAFSGVKLYQYSRVAYLKPYEEKYNIEYPVGILEQFCDAYGKNQDIAGAVSIPDTKTDKYVVNAAAPDAPYLEKGADIKKDQKNIAIALKSSDADLEGIYSTPEGFLKSSQKIVFNTLFEKSTYKVVSVFYTNTKAEADSGYIFPYNLCGNMTQKSFENYEDRIKSRRLYDTGYSISNEDYFLTLSVDSDFMENFRFVVLCVRIEEKDFEKSSTAVPNDNIHYPQVWYDKYEKVNPFRFSAKWYPELYIDEENQRTTKQSIKDFE